MSRASTSWVSGVEVVRTGGGDSRSDTGQHFYSDSDNNMGGYEDMMIR